MPVDLPAGRLDITYIKTNDFVGIFEALGENERKFSARLVRQMKSHLYKLLLDDDPKEQIYVATDLDSKDDLDKVQFVYGAGVIEKLSDIGYDVESNDNLIKDIVDIGERKYNYKEIVQRTLLTPNKYHLPVHCFIKRSGLEMSLINSKVRDRKVLSHRSILNGSKLSEEHINRKYNSLTELIVEEPRKKIEYALYLYPDKIDIDELKELIVSNIDLLENGKSTQKTQIRKLIKYYDWLKFGRN
ncbi:MAG: hypothetical protein ACQEWV_31310 [Bacillota bacterium]